MNCVIGKKLSETLTSYSISFDTDSSFGPISNIQLVGGRPVEVNGTKAVAFTTKLKGQTICVGYANRPELAALVAEFETIQARLAAEREAVWAAEKATQDAIEKPLLDAMHAESAALRASIPATHTLVTVNQTGNLDGDPILEYTADSIILSWQDVEVVGVASAIRPGALGEFATECVCSISKTKLAKIKTEKLASAETAKDAQEATEKELKETEIPQEAIALYNRYHGDEDKAWEDSNETAWALIRKWEPYIEAQHGMDPSKMQQLIVEASREANYGINEG